MLIGASTEKEDASSLAPVREFARETSTVVHCWLAVWRSEARLEAFDSVGAGLTVRVVSSLIGPPALSQFFLQSPALQTLLYPPSPFPSTPLQPLLVLVRV